MKNKFALISALVIFVCAACFAGMSGSNYAIKMGGEKISAGEYRVYLYEQEKLFEQTGGDDIWETDFDGIPAEEVAKQNAVNSLAVVKAAVNNAESLGIKLDADDLENVLKESQSFFDELGKDTADKFGLDEEDIYDIIKEGYIQKKVFEYITNSFEISEADFDSYFENYYQEHKKEFNHVKVKYIFIKIDNEKNSDGVENDLKNIESVYGQLLTGSDFETVQQKYSDSAEKGLVEVEEGVFEQEVEEAAYSLEQGEVSPIIRTGKGFYILKAYEVDIPDMNELKNNVKEIYISEKKQEIYQKQNDKWILKLDIEKNDEVFENIFIQKYPAE